MDTGEGRWLLALAGLAAFVFAVAALSGPGRIDIVDGQTRYEVARSLVEHGDSVVRDQRVRFNVFPGRGGRPYTYYRFPQSLLGAVAIVAADLSGPDSEGRRHFFFVLTSAFAAAALAVGYALWFRARGATPAGALGWALAGIFCTPTWFYATSTFDDMLSAASGVGAFLLAWWAASRERLLPALLAGAMLGFAFNCKEIMGAFVFAALAAVLDPARRRGKPRPLRLAILGGLGAGVLVYIAYDLYKMPLSVRAEHVELMAHYVRPWPGAPSAAFAALTVSPGKGMLWYCPPLLLCCIGVWRRHRQERWPILGVLATCGVAFLFILSISYFSGDPSWGPRYLTPLIALLWLWAPVGAARCARAVTVSLLVLGFGVQLLALSVDPHRLYVERGLPSAFYDVLPWLYFQPAISHLLNRPREIGEILAGAAARAPHFTPSPSPTFAFPVLDFVERGPRAVRRYHVLSSLRPWWISQRYLPPSQRPVPLFATFVTFLVVCLGGAGCMAPSLGAGRGG